MNSQHAMESAGATRYATGAGLMLLAGVVSGLLLALVISGFHMRFYIPLLMPAIIGWGVGSAVAFVRTKSRVPDALPALAAAVLGALIAYGGYHIIVYGRLLGFLAENMTSLVDRAAGDPRAAVQQFFEEKTGQTGIWAYLQFVSEGRGAKLSPLGFLGAAELGTAVTVIGVALETCIAVVGAIAFVAIRSGPLRLNASAEALEGSRVREIIARTDDATLTAAMHALDAGDFEAAGRVLRNPTVEDTFAVAMVFNPYTAEAYTMEIHELTPAGLGTLRARRELSSWDGQALCDELRIQR
jgi:hypothetical protein